MITLGVHIGHDAAAAIVVDGQLRYAEEEERHTGVKAQGGCPWLAIDAALAAVSARDADVDRIALTWSIERYLECRRTLAEHARSVGNVAWYDKRQREIATVREAIAGLGARFMRATIVDVPHHHAHIACSVTFGSGTADNHGGPVLGIVADALGDAESLTVFRAPTAAALVAAPEVIERCTPFDSIGFFYKRAAEAFGFSGREACGYLMALSGCADGRDLVHGDELVGFDPFARAPFPAQVTARLGLDRPGDDFLARAREANAIQRITETYLHERFARLIAAHKPAAIYVSGGVSLNCVALARLAAAFPATPLVACAVKKDSGTAVGAAVVAAGPQAHGERSRSLRLGTEITGRETAFSDQQVFASRDELVSALLADLAADRIVALVDGGGELGPRALGARSILARASGPALAATLNGRIKQRFVFQPFAGAFLAGELTQYSDAYMSYAVRFDAPPAHLAGIIHRDGSTRAQIVAPDEHTVMSDLLVELRRRGEPAVVLNTSLNARGEPMPRTADDARRTVAKLGLDAIYTPIGRVACA